MSSRWSTLVGLLAALPVTCVGAPAAHSLIANCAREAPASARGLVELGRYCPGIGRAAADLRLGALLPADWRMQVSARGLADLAALAERYGGPPPPSRLDPARLARTALALRLARTPRSWWERVESWIARRLLRASGRASWSRYLSWWPLGPRASRVLFETVAAALLLAAALLGLRELKVVRFLGQRSRGRPRAGQARIATTPLTRPHADLENLEGVPPREQSVLLLRALVAALRHSRRLDRDRDLTCRELSSSARFDDAAQRADFERIAVLAERSIYGSLADAPAAIPEPWLIRARALRAELAAPARSALDAAAGPLRA